MPDNIDYRVYLGAYTGEESAAKGIRLATADANDHLSRTEQVTEAADPSFLAWAPDGATLYAANELDHGRVTAFGVEVDGGLHEINSQPSLGAAPCHLSVHPTGRYLLTANYQSGSFVVHPIEDGGVLRQACHVFQHSGSGPDADRQQGPHVHQVISDPHGRRLLAVDLGTDTVCVYDFDPETGHMVLVSEAKQHAGAGPRHLAFHPSGTRLYLINELDSTLTECDYDPDTGELRPRETLSTIPENSPKTNLAAEVVVSPDGRFVYGSNRGEDSIAVFTTGSGGERFRLLDIQPAGVTSPRHMSMSPTGRTLFVAGQLSGTVRAFTLEETGTLTPVGPTVSTPNPVCVLPSRRRNDR